MSRYVNAYSLGYGVELTDLLDRLADGHVWSWCPVLEADAIDITIDGRSERINGLCTEQQATLAIHRLLANQPDRELVSENAAEYEAAANGHRLL